ncbi:aromatic acid exporter family protein [Nocardioides sp. GXQ0305]|uniref:FUSC family protein n=1 Tax=Nocardioides sp. GXQ0305 TaxID=3423912 RepID=UPI003D7C464D
MKGALSRRMRDPIFWNDVTQLTKTVVAAVVAWVLAASVLDLPQPFLAPWSALLVVHATVYRTYSQGMRQVAAAVIAVLLAAAVGHVFGLSTAGVAILLAVGLVLGSLRWFGTEATTIATTGLVVLTTGFTDDMRLFLRLLDTGIGIGVGLLVNVAVWPPLLRRTAIFSLNRIDDRIGELLTDIASSLASGAGTDVDAWVERTRDIDAEIDEAWSLVRQARESARMNPRRSAGQFRDPRLWDDLLHRMEQAVAETRSMAHTLGGPAGPREEWEPPFAHAWTRLLTEAGHAIAEADADQIHVVRKELQDLVGDLTRKPTSLRWPIQGALLINLRNILDAMDEVALASPLDDPPRPLAHMRSRASGPIGPAGPPER